MVQEAAETIGNATNDFAGYQAVLRGLQTVEEMYGEVAKDMEFELYLSNELIKQYLNNEQQIKDASLVPQFIEVHNLRVATVSHLTLTYVEKEQNVQAYRLVQEALDGGK
jgi:ribonuclease HI